MLQKKLNLFKEWGRYGLFYVKGFMFGDRFVKIVSDFEINFFRPCLVAFGSERSLVNHQLAHP